MQLLGPNKQQEELLQQEIEETFATFEANVTDIYKRLLRQTRQLQAVTEIGQRLISTLDYRQVLRQLMQEVIPLFNVERGSFWTVNRELELVEFEFSLNHEGDEDEISDAIRKLPEDTFRLGSGFVGQAALSGKPLIQNEVASNKQHLKEVDIISKHTTRCILTVPLLRNETAVGVIQLLNPMDRDQFTFADQEMLQMLTPWVALALENARLYEAALAQLEREHQIRIRAELEAQAAGMLTIMAHHLKNQLGSARVHLHHVRHSEGLNKKQIEGLEKTDENMKRSIQITQALLKPYVLAESEYAAPADLVSKAWQYFKHPLSIEFSMEVPADLPPVWIEAGSTVDYFQELFTNAVRAIERRLERGEIAGGRLRIQGRLNDDNQVELLFSNNGPPIPERNWQKIFEKFTTAEHGEARNNFGLGLWGMKTFFRRQGGDVYVLRSDENQTTFVVKMNTIGEEEWQSERENITS